MNIKFFNRTILKTVDHYIYAVDCKDIGPVLEDRLEAFKLTVEDISLIKGSQALRKNLAFQPEYVTGYGFKNHCGSIIGYLFVMTKGGTLRPYRIRNIDAFIYSVAVFKDHRGNHYAGEMLTYVLNKLHKQGIDKVYLACSKNNAPAIRAYERLGFKIVDSKFFIQILRWAIPYHTL